MIILGTLSERQEDEKHQNLWGYEIDWNRSFLKFVDRPDDSLFSGIGFYNDNESHDEPIIVSPADYKQDNRSVTLAEVMIVFREGYFKFLEIFRQLTLYSLLPLQPILLDYNTPFISLPRVLSFGTIWIYDNVLLNYNIDENGRKELPAWREIFEKLDIYASIMKERYQIISSEIEKREIFRHNNGGNRNRKSGNAIWSIIMTKGSVYRKLNWSRTKLDCYLKRHPDSILELERQNYRFNCNDSAFCNFTVDEAFNKLNAENDKN